MLINMRRGRQVGVWVIGMVLFGITFLSIAAPESAIGYWQTVDDKTGKILSIVHIYKDKDKTLSGKIYKIIPILGQKPHDKCIQCKEALHNKPIQGLRIIWGMTQDDTDTWIGGRALDPKSGSIYRARMKSIDQGCKLQMRGYIGIPLFGRTETWLRANQRGDASPQCKNK